MAFDGQFDAPLARVSVPHAVVEPELHLLLDIAGEVVGRDPGRVDVEGGFAARQCLVQDISSAGAKIVIEAAYTLPAKLRLGFARDARNGHNCQVVWRRGYRAGVKFVR